MARQGRGANAPTATYPTTKLAQNMRVVSQLIQSGAGARVYYATQSGYDTHSAQLNTHGQLLREFSEALGAFLNDLKAAQLEDRVVVVAFSEFGRRVAENDIRSRQRRRHQDGDRFPASLCFAARRLVGRRIARGVAGSSRKVALDCNLEGIAVRVASVRRRF